jgi:hypothetical protein
VLSAAFVGLVVVSQALATPEDSRYETVVVAPQEPSRDGSFSLDARTASTMPGASGDPGRALENAPGVGRLAPSAASSEGLVLWGTTPQESRVLFDGAPIPSLFHFGGWRSVVPADGFDGVAVFPGAFGAAYGRSLGGIVAITSRTPSAERLQGWAAVDLLDTSAGMETPLGENTHLLVTGRLGYIDRLAGALSSDPSRSLFVLPSYRDLLVKATVAVAPGKRLSIEVLGADDRRRLDLAAASAIDTLSEARSRNFARILLSYGEAEEADGTAALVWLGRDHAALAEAWGLVPIAEDTQTYAAGVRLSHSLSAGAHWFELGVDGDVQASTVARSGSLTDPPREGDETVFGAPPGGSIGTDTWHPVLADLAPYATAELRWRRFELRPGLRLDGQFVSSDRTLPPTGMTPKIGFSRSTWAVEPRLAANVGVRPWLSMGAAFGIHHQLPDAADLSPVFGSPSLGPGRAVSGVLSVRATQATLAIETAVFGRRLDHLATRNPDAQPTLAHALVDTGQGRSYGVQVLVRTRCEGVGVCALASYTLSRAERRGPGDASWRLFDFDQTHLLSTTVSYRWRRWFLGGRFRYATGMPRTPVVGAYVDTHAGIYRPILGEHNASRLPDFVELDGRIERTWRLGRSAIVASVELLNATNRTNAEEIVYAGDYSTHSFVSGLPLFVLAGLRLEI